MPSCGLVGVVVPLVAFLDRRVVAKADLLHGRERVGVVFEERRAEADDLVGGHADLILDVRVAIGHLLQPARQPDVAVGRVRDGVVADLVARHIGRFPGGGLHIRARQEEGRFAAVLQHIDGPRQAADLTVVVEADGDELRHLIGLETARRVLRGRHVVLARPVAEPARARCRRTTIAVVVAAIAVSGGAVVAGAATEDENERYLTHDRHDVHSGVEPSRPVDPSNQVPGPICSSCSSLQATPLRESGHGATIAGA